MAKIQCKQASRTPKTVAKWTSMPQNDRKIRCFWNQEGPKPANRAFSGPKMGLKLAENTVIYRDFDMNMQKTLGFCQKWPLDPPSRAYFGPKHSVNRIGRPKCPVKYGIFGQNWSNIAFWSPKRPFLGPNFGQKCPKRVPKTL